MMARAAMLAVAAFLLAAGSFLAFIRYELRPRRARLDPVATGLPVEAVAIPSSSGARLAGWFLPGAGRGAVLLLHGAKSNRLVQVERMRFLRGAGYSMLAIDFRAHGESTGDRITMGQLESWTRGRRSSGSARVCPANPWRCSGYRWAAQRRLSDSRSRPTP